MHPGGVAGENDAIGADVENATGGAGADVLTGNDGVNALSGGEGADTLTGLGAVDAFSGGGGDDDVRAVDGNGEPVDCGAGSADVAAVDVADQPTDCEVLAIANLLVDADRDGFPTGARQGLRRQQPGHQPRRAGGARKRGRRELRRRSGAVLGDRGIDRGLLPLRRRPHAGDPAAGDRIPAGSRVVLKCKPPKGRRRACPFRRISRWFPAERRRLRLAKAFKGRKLRPGTVIEVRVTGADVIGKVVRYRTRRGDRAPVKRSRCLVPGATRTSRCP